MAHPTTDTLEAILGRATGLALASLCILSGCGAVSGSEVDGSCDCLASPATGWTGPVAYGEHDVSASAPSCIGGFPDVGPAAHVRPVDFEPANHTCTCHCDPKPGADCGTLGMCAGTPGMTTCLKNAV